RDDAAIGARDAHDAPLDGRRAGEHAVARLPPQQARAGLVVAADLPVAVDEHDAAVAGRDLGRHAAGELLRPAFPRVPLGQPPAACPLSSRQHSSVPSLLEKYTRSPVTTGSPSISRRPPRSIVRSTWPVASDAIATLPVRRPATRCPPPMPSIDTGAAKRMRRSGITTRVSSTTACWRASTL